MPLAASGRPGTWSTNRASACKQLLTRDFLTTIFVHADGEAVLRPDGSCFLSADYDGGFNSILIGLSDHVTLADWNGLTTFHGAAPVSGLGDRAVRSNDATGLYVYKNDGRMCSVSLMPLGEAPKLAGDALAKKLGELCNKLFALQ